MCSEPPPAGFASDSLVRLLQENFFERALMGNDRHQPAAGLTNGGQHVFQFLLPRERHPTAAASLQHAYRRLLDQGNAVSQDAFTDDLDGLRRMPADNVLDSTYGQHLSLRENSDSIANHFDVGDDMRAEKDSFPLVTKTQDDVPHVFSSQRIESRHRLV